MPLAAFCSLFNTLIYAFDLLLLLSLINAVQGITYSCIQLNFLVILYSPDGSQEDTIRTYGYILLCTIAVYGTTTLLHSLSPFMYIVAVAHHAHACTHPLLLQLNTNVYEQQEQLELGLSKLSL